MLLSIPVYEDAGLILKSSFLYKSTVIDDAHVFPSFEICKFSGADALNSGPVTSTELVIENHAYDAVIKQANEIANIKKDDNIKFLFFFISATFISYNNITRVHTQLMYSGYASRKTRLV